MIPMEGTISLDTSGTVQLNVRVMPANTLTSGSTVLWITGFKSVKTEVHVRVKVVSFMLKPKLQRHTVIASKIMHGCVSYRDVASGHGQAVNNELPGVDNC